MALSTAVLLSLTLTLALCVWVRRKLHSSQVHDAWMLELPERLEVETPTPVARRDREPALVSRAVACSGSPADAAIRR